MRRPSLPSLALAAALLAACGPLPAPLPVPRDTDPVRVELRELGPWREFVVPGLAMLAATGRRYVLAPRGDVVLAHMPEARMAEGWAGYWDTAERRAYVDPARVFGALQWHVVVAHELLHARGARHVCRYPGEVAGCSPVGYGVAVLNPTLPSDETTCDPWAHACAPDAQLTTLTELDLAELRRAERR